MIEELKRQKRIHGLNETISKNEIDLLIKKVPIQKIIGFIQFEDLKIFVDRNVLIPRYETQEVVLKSLEFINKNSKVLDLCCGSGYIGLTINHKTGANVTCSDIDDEAILQTKKNAKINDLKINIVKSDLFSSIDQKYDVIVSNPPYIPKKRKLDKSVLDYEPHTALFGGEDGNYFYKMILKDVKKHLNKKGVLVFEISPDNSFFLKEQGFEILQDINSKDRIAFKIFN